ncbi:MAG: AlpA family phage regulatory protein [Bdellovibrionales bacterium]|nr:AlpA family phage regulatory protein [Bdellovibrionales bacterium]
MELLKEKILRGPEVEALVRLSTATISRQEKAGLFPKRRRIGIRAVGWYESEIQKWLSQQVHEPAKKHRHSGAVRDVEGYDPTSLSPLSVGRRE